MGLFDFLAAPKKMVLIGKYVFNNLITDDQGSQVISLVHQIHVSRIIEEA